MVDDGNGNQVQFDSTGAYTWTNCSTVTISGMGVVTVKGPATTLRDLRTDRRLEVNVDSSSKKANGSLQLSNPSRYLTITDRNTVGDVCGCMSQSGYVRSSVGR